MTNHSDPLSDFIENTVIRFARDPKFRVRLLAEAGQTAQEKAARLRREVQAGQLRRRAS